MGFDKRDFQPVSSFSQHWVWAPSALSLWGLARWRAQPTPACFGVGGGGGTEHAQRDCPREPAQPRSLPYTPTHARQERTLDVCGACSWLLGDKAVKAALS